MTQILVFSSNNDCIVTIENLLVDMPCNIKIASMRREAINILCNQPIDLCLIDAENDGEGFCAALKLIDDKMPKIVLSPTNTESDRLIAFENGCDDFIHVSTISQKEFKLRIQVVLKRNTSSKSINLAEPVAIGNSTMDFVKRNLICKEQLISLSRKEASLLKLFYLNKGKLLSREHILKEVWNTSDYYASKSMDVYLSKLRKILQCEEAVTIENIHGSGYVFTESVFN